MKHTDTHDARKSDIEDKMIAGETPPRISTEPDDSKWGDLRERLCVALGWTKYKYDIGRVDWLSPDKHLQCYELPPLDYNLVAEARAKLICSSSLKCRLAIAILEILRPELRGDRGEWELDFAMMNASPEHQARAILEAIQK